MLLGMAKTAAQKIEALLAKAQELLEDVPAEGIWQFQTGAARGLDELAIATDDRINEDLARYGIDAKADEGVRIGIRLVARLLANHDLDAWEDYL